MLDRARQVARGYPDVRANTVSSFALGDYEWILAFEADELHRIVDLMRDLRAADARRHMREEIPFYTGRRRDSPPSSLCGEQCSRPPAGTDVHVAFSDLAQVATGAKTVETWVNVGFRCRSQALAVGWLQERDTELMQ